LHAREPPLHNYTKYCASWNNTVLTFHALNDNEAWKIVYSYVKGPVSMAKKVNEAIVPVEFYG
jgi:hypothetical protein